MNDKSKDKLTKKSKDKLNNQNWNTNADKLKICFLNDFVFKKCMGEYGCEYQLKSLFEAFLPEFNYTGLRITENVIINADFKAGKSVELDIRSRLPNGIQINIEVQNQK